VPRFFRAWRPTAGCTCRVSWPRLAPSDFEANDLASVAVRLLAPFVAGDPLAPLLGSIAAESVRLSS